MIRKGIGLLLGMTQALSIQVFSQVSDLTPLFQDKGPLAIRLTISIRHLRNKTNDSTYVPSVLYYARASDQWDSIPVGIRTRGNFRKKECYIPPMRIKIKKEDAKGTVFEGNKSLKLVLPCRTAPEYNTLIIKEFMCYKLYELITPYAFNTRLTNLTLNERGRKKTRTFQLIGFFIEDDDLVARRHHAKVIEMIIHPRTLHDTSATRHDFFQYMIANTDWSTAFQHNARIIQLESAKKVPLAYDFDMSGFVNAPYATVNEDLGISSPRERLYRGYCQNPALFNAIRKEYLSLKPKIDETINRFQSYFKPNEFISLKEYLDEFFVIIESDAQFRMNVEGKCLGESVSR